MFGEFALHEPWLHRLMAHGNKGRVHSLRSSLQTSSGLAKVTMESNLKWVVVAKGKGFELGPGIFSTLSISLKAHTSNIYANDMPEKYKK